MARQLLLGIARASRYLNNFMLEHSFAWNAF